MPATRGLLARSVIGLRAALARQHGLTFALAAILIWSFWPVWTRHAVSSSLSPDDIVFLRFGVGGLLFLPFLLIQAKSIRPRAWLRGLGLALCQGAPFVLLVAMGLRLAPANHAASLTTGVTPLFAALLGAALFSEPVAGARWRGLALIVVGAGTLAFAGGSAAIGDLFFLAAAAIASIYIVCVPRSGLTAFQAAAMVSVFSMIFYAPIYFAVGDIRLHAADAVEVVTQGLYQGVLMAFVSFIFLNSAIARVGAARVSAVIALVPAASLLLAIPVLGEWPSSIELVTVLLISSGVYVAARAHGIGRPISPTPVDAAARAT